MKNKVLNIKSSRTKGLKPPYFYLFIFIAVSLWAALISTILYEERVAGFQSFDMASLVETQSVDIIIDSPTSLDLPNTEEYVLSSHDKLPEWVLDVDKLSTNDIGSYRFVFKSINSELLPQRKVINVNIALQKLDEEEVMAAIMSALGSQSNYYGVYLHDLKRDQTFSWQANVQFPPGSISKIPVALLTLRDIDSGKYTFETTYPISNSLKHSQTDDLGRLPAGTNVTIATYMEKLLTQSNNTAQYHLRNMLGGTYDALNPRTHEELGVFHFYEDPHHATPRAVGTVFTKLYKRELLSEELTTYFLDTLYKAAPSLRDGIPAGLPEREGIKAITKVGFLFGGREGFVYGDAGIVYGEKTDYVLVVLNNKSEYGLAGGSQKVKKLSSLLYPILN